MAKLTLPIDSHLKKIVENINPGSLSTDPFILTSSPGSGKTTRLPVALLTELQRIKSPKKIVVLVPKRIAAVAAAQRICDENQWRIGSEVGFEVRFENQTTTKTQLIFMTTGHFLKKVLNNDFFNEIGWLIFDEFHERLLENDFLLGFAREQKILNNDLQIIVMSATLSVDPLKAYLQTNNIYQINEQPYRLDIKYSTKNQFLSCTDLFFDHLKTTLREAAHTARSNILIFLPGLREITRAEQILAPIFPSLKFLHFHGQLTLDEQRTVMNTLAESEPQLQRYVVLATNICETSLTLPNTDAVIDSGLERTARVEKAFGFSDLLTQRISAFSATQRAGRAARQSNGFCFRLWHKTDELSMKEAIQPDILSRPLENIFLYACGLMSTDPRQFEWLTPPQQKWQEHALAILREKNLITPEFKTTPLGFKLLNIPLDIDSAYLFYQLVSEGFANFACDLYSRIEELPRKRQTLSMGEDDLDFIFNLPLTYQQKQKHTQLLDISRKFNNQQLHQSKPDFKKNFIELHFKYVKNKILALYQKHSRSYYGFGAELDPASSAHNNDFYIALHGYENEQSSTRITYAIGIDKSLFIKNAADSLTSESSLEFDAEKSSFFKKSSKKFGAITVSEEPRQIVSLHELDSQWIDYLADHFDALLQDNTSYVLLMAKFKFIKKLQTTAPHLFDFAPLSAEDETDLKNALCTHIQTFLKHFSELKTYNFYSILKYIEVPDQKLKRCLEVLGDFPDEYTLNSGRICKINYTDEKAPLISAKVQDFYGQKKHPKIFKDKIDLICELLAPNYRPTQVTKNLERFWKESYFEIKKDLKGRYPKHDWPENPEDFQKPPRRR